MQHRHPAHAFTNYTIYAFVVGEIILLFTPILQRMINGEKIYWPRLFSLH